MQIAKCVLEFKSHVCSGKAITDSVEIICRCAIVVVNTLNSNSTPFVHTVYYQNRLLLLRFEWTRLDVKKRAKNKTKTQLKKIDKRIETKITTTTKYLRHTKIHTNSFTICRSIFCVSSCKNFQPIYLRWTSCARLKVTV